MVEFNLDDLLACEARKNGLVRFELDLPTFE